MQESRGELQTPDLLAGSQSPRPTDYETQNSNSWNTVSLCKFWGACEGIAEEVEQVASSQHAIKAYCLS